MRAGCFICHGVTLPRLGPADPARLRRIPSCIPERVRISGSDHVRNKPLRLPTESKSRFVLSVSMIP